MIKFDNYPPLSAEDVNFTDAAEEGMLKLDSAAHPLGYAETALTGATFALYGRAVGHTVVASLDLSPSPSPDQVDLLTAISKRLGNMVGAVAYHSMLASDNFRGGFNQAVREAQKSQGEQELLSKVSQ